MTDLNKIETTDESGVDSSDMLGALRRTGRTTRMLEEAKQLNDEGRAVYVVAAWSQDRNRLEVEFGSRYGVKHGVKFETPESLRNLDWPTMRLKRAHPNCVVLADHYAFDSPNTTLSDSRED